ncbi:MAG TPA: ATP-binding cassette domain-containing protein [Nitrospiraceae bacterium]|nr:ATP-binding cassette domain-containing protein [Nitrospiraceae bacterium]
MARQQIIEIRNATVYRGDTQVFTDLSLDIAVGCQTAILGPNGAGKSTLLKLLSRELYPVCREGSSVRLFGEEQWNVWDLRTRLGIVSHDLQRQYVGDVTGMNVVLSGYYSSMNVYAHQRFRDEDMEHAHQILKILEVDALQDRLFNEMSTGEQRRFLLGRALVHGPGTLVLDEPTSGLDLKACFQYIEIIRRLMKADKTIILVTHHIHEIPPEVSRVVLLKHGKVIADGPKQDILTSERLTTLFDTPVKLVQGNGFYQAMPDT